MGGFILHGSLWALDGPVIVPRLAMKEQNHRMKNYENFVISVTLRVVRGCPENVLTMR